MDADLQNPPEEIPKLIEAMERGHDVVGGFRMDRQDSKWRLVVSRLHNIVREWITPARIKMEDEGCMLRAYRRDIVDLMVASGEASTFIPALALSYASNPAEVGVEHAARDAGTSSYGFYDLIRYNFDLITNFSLVPLQVFTLFGMFVSMMSTFFFIYLMIRRVIIGPEAEGLFTLFAVLFFLIGTVLMGLGIMGEYIGRIYQEIRKRPRFVIREIVEKTTETEKNIMSLNVLIIGANGFIGNSLVEAILNEKDWSISALDLASNHLTPFLSNPRFKFKEGDMRENVSWIESQIEQCDVMLPLAAIATPATYVNNPLQIFELDFEANLDLIRQCVKHKKRVVFPSTSEVYGMCPDEAFDEDTSQLVLGPISMQRWIYSCSKQMMDRIIYAYGGS